MADEPFDFLVTKERARLNEQRDDITRRQEQLDEQLAALDREIKALNAYEAVRVGAITKKAHGTRSSKRNNVLQLLEAKPQGMTRGDILDTMNIKGNKSEEQSVSNILKQLKKKGRIKSLDDGRYTIT